MNTLVTRARRGRPRHAAHWCDGDTLCHAPLFDLWVETGRVTGFQIREGVPRTDYDIVEVRTYRCGHRVECRVGSFSRRLYQ